MDYSSDEEPRLPVVEEEFESHNPSVLLASVDRTSLRVQAELPDELPLAPRTEEDTLPDNPSSSKSISKVKKLFSELKMKVKGEMLTLKRIMACLPGCAFLGSQATATKAWINEYGKNLTRVVIDSGADITLISHTAWSQLSPQPKVKAGQRINLVQVTGASTISGFISLPLFFDTDNGPVQLDVEAYIVIGMTTLFILGNDFADQFALLVVRDENGAQLHFSKSGRTLQVENSIGPSLKDKAGQVFCVHVSKHISYLV
ncbi:hypothetical protein M422DRAFT_54542 [Sphaerobolus stellatus SS14]|uniref:Peptidase A2 domain-containing protein n=1 Tax=Sphaerobolus stellatus (strain SS14) TaxID=990650 RepID=A0A0C9UTE5_SPHS4|nr:hypothetical protein M422DRAFT_54542 [Sphaerobolus stellatus SS14]